jgi:FAD/FMN-containing dehydrogenase
VRLLRAVVGSEHVLTDPDTMAGHQVDWTGRWHGRAAAVVRPGDADEVAAILRVCMEAGVPVVPQGGNTGLVGGGVPRRGEVVVSLRRLDRISPVDTAASQISVGAGVTLGHVQRAVAPTGLTVAVDLAARDSATVGGMIATNAGGIHVLRYGAMRAQVAGIQVVLADGRCIERMSGLVKDNVGYDLTSLMVGSEGTLGVVTAARLRLVPRPTETLVAVIPTDGLADAVSLTTVLRQRLPTLHALEAWDDEATTAVVDHTGLPELFAVRSPWTVLVEVAGPHGTVDDAARALADICGTDHALVGWEPAQCARLWAYREHLTESIAAQGSVHKLDVALPAERMSPFEGELRARLTSLLPDGRTVVFGHLGDGNLHVNVLGAQPDDASVDDIVLRLVADHHGSISAEHGIGVAKAPWLTLGRSASDIDAMRSIKCALDPTGILNPGVIFAT